MPWTRDDIAFLHVAAGEMPEADIAALLDMAEEDVTAMEEKLGLERFYKREMEWCVDCGTYRTIRDGICPVCRALEQLEALREAYGTATASMAGRYRAPFAIGRRNGNAPQRPSVAGMTASQAAETLEAWDKTVEAWELQQIVTEKNRIKQATHRAREIKERLEQ